MKTFIHFIKNQNIYLTHLILGILFIYPFNSFAENPPSSHINKTETFVLECPNNPQHTTYDMDTCNGTMITQLKAVQEKYIAAIQREIQSFYKDNPTLLKETMEAFGEENKAWDTLINAASDATFSYWQGGTVRGLMSTGRKIELMKYRIHNQWISWLTSMSSSEPAILPEPLFDTRN